MLSRSSSIRFNCHETHVVGRSLTENSTPVTREFPAGRKSGPIHGTLGNRCLYRCADVCQLAEGILWTRILTSTREIIVVRIKSRAFAIVRAISDWFLGKLIYFLSRLNDRHRVATRNVRVMVFIDGSLSNSIIR